MNVALAKTDTGCALSDAFAAARDRLPGTGQVPHTRQLAFDSYARRGLPHRRIEDWKYTDLRALMREVLPQAPAPDQAALDAAAKTLKAHAIKGVRRFVLVDGFFAPGLSDLEDVEQGLTIRTLRETLESGYWPSLIRLMGIQDADPTDAGDRSDPMIALNAAMMTDGVMIEVAGGTQLARPLHIIHVATTAAPAAMFTRSSVRLGNAATATLIESFLAAGNAAAYQVHNAVMMLVGAGARLDHIRLAEDHRDATCALAVGRSSPKSRS